MLSYHVVKRTSEIGIRMALGAPRRNVLLLIVGDGMKLAAIGAAIGLAVAVGLAQVMSVTAGWRWLDRLLYVCNNLSGALAVALLACYIPANRATKWIRWLRCETSEPHRSLLQWI